MSPTEFADKMQECNETAQLGNIDVANCIAAHHIVALLKQLGYDKGAEIYQSMPKG